MFFSGKRFLAVALACLLQHAAVFSQPALPPLKISRIIITGNKKTKPSTILRELSFHEGDTLSLTRLLSQFDHARTRLYNTRLFNEVIISVQNSYGYQIAVEIDVKERWYIFPIPYFKPADRNLSAWADHHYKLNRVNYGLKMSYYNFTGSNDKLKAWLITGYNKQLKLSYEQPYADRSLRHGYSASFFYAASKELNAATFHNRQLFINSDSIAYSNKYLDEQFNLTLGYTYRPAIKTRHSVKVTFGYDRIDSAVAVVNPKYFKAGQRSVSFPEIKYSIDYNNIDYVGYPLKGFIAEAGLLKRGFSKSMNLFELYGQGTRGWPLGNNTYYGLQGYFSLKLPFDQPFYNMQQMGYNDVYLRGLENYVIDGVVTTMARNTFRKEILSFDIFTPYLRSIAHEKIPFRIYVKAYGDAGYVYHKDPVSNTLNNRLLYTAGAGLDIVTLYDVVVRFEYSFNQLGENGLFLHFKNEF